MSLDAVSSTNSTSPISTDARLDDLVKRYGVPVVFDLHTLLSGSGMDSATALKNARKVVQWHLEREPQEGPIADDCQWRRRILQGVLGGYHAKGASSEQSDPPGQTHYQLLQRSVLTATYRSDLLLDAVIVLKLPHDEVARTHGLRDSRAVSSALAMTASLIKKRFDYGPLYGVSDECRLASASLPPTPAPTLPDPTVGATRKVRSVTPKPAQDSGTNLPPRLGAAVTEVDSLNHATRAVRFLGEIAPVVGETARQASQTLGDSVRALNALDTVGTEWKSWIRRLLSSEVFRISSNAVRSLELTSTSVDKLRPIVDGLITHGSSKGLSAPIGNEDTLGGKFDQHLRTVCKTLESVASVLESLEKENKESRTHDRKVFLVSARSIQRFLTEHIATIESGVSALRDEVHAPLLQILTSAVEERNAPARSATARQQPDARGVPPAKPSSPAKKERTSKIVKSKPIAVAPSSVKSKIAVPAIEHSPVLPDDEDDVEEMSVRKSPRLEARSFGTDVNRASLRVESEILDALMNARLADWCRVTLNDGRSLEGALIFNEFTGNGRLINVDEEVSTDFAWRHVESVKY